MAVHADLHVHTTNSDGSLTLAGLPAVARQAGVRAVAVTDHDRVHPDLDSPVVVRDGVTVIHGIELRVEASEAVDLLGYGVSPTPELDDEIDRLQRDRETRGQAIIDRVEDHLGIDLDIGSRPGIGRPHIARAVAEHPGTPYDVQGAFDHLIGDGRPCHVPRDLPRFDRGRRLLSGACTLVGLAHPFRYDDPIAALELARDLDVVERYYPYEEDIDVTPLVRMVEETGILPVGGSDSHTDEIGRVGLDETEYRRVADRLSAPGGS